jgi:hypothetical protein
MNLSTNFQMQKRKSIVRFNLYHSKHPAILIHADRIRGMYRAKGVILFHWLFIGIERIPQYDGFDVSLVWNLGLKPVLKYSGAGGEVK